ncbi:hypothetical protein MTsPCn9_09920 [Croceitalea sp. MTPC9]|uniref:DUF4382 domain-containing protein n=1 Tax=Croceitalea marina TaxID=1775166 RepID=A0ABW5MZX2_9FLAO|nr:hypothetical protein MTsPCn5_37620 [Croceitalea sp. MTPC5]GMN11401.1 hypothetical protein MTsPCn6_27320 [Croceitalea sp. MTPC6]GMN16056.1 hypothetical protein MTsPCn9_09920 [Croceitalea sp. MTPC9]
MIKKQFLAITILALLTLSCSSDDDPRDNYPKKKDISFSVTSSDTDRLSRVTIKIIGNGVEISNSSYSQSHLPLTREYLKQSIPFQTLLGITYEDNSGGEIGVPFEPYNIKFIIKVDSETVAEKEITINGPGTVDSVEFTFN